MAAATLLAAALMATSAAADPVITEYRCDCEAVNDLASGVGGNLWFTTDHPSGVGNLTPAGAVTVFDTPDLGAAIQNITQGADGNMWFTDQGRPTAAGTELPAIGRVTASGTITEYPIPGASCSASSCNSTPGTIVAGPQNNVWFTDTSGAGTIGRATPAGVVTEYGKLGGAFVGVPSGLTQGPGGFLYFSACSPAIVDVAPDGTVASGGTTCSGAKETHIVVPSSGHVWWIYRSIADAHVYEEDVNPLPGSQIHAFALPHMPTALIEGPDGNLWYAFVYGSSAPVFGIGRITLPPPGAPSSTAPTVNEFTAGLHVGSNPVSDPSSLITSLAAGPDGNVWFTDGTCQGGNDPRLGWCAIGRITPAGQITEYPIPAAASLAHGAVCGSFGCSTAPAQLVLGADGNLYYVEAGAPAGIGRVQLGQAPAVTTGPASGVTSTRATVAGTVNPLGSAVTSITVDYGTTAAYGHSAAATPATLPAGNTASPVSAMLAGLPPGTVIHYRVVATNGRGTTNGPDATFTTSGGAGPGVPTLASVKQSHSIWKLGNQLAHLARASAPVGTTFSFSLGEAAIVSFTFNRYVGSGRRVGKRCVPTSARNRHKPRCARLVAAGLLRLNGHPGLNRVTFQGPLSHTKRLRPGRYTVVIAATAAGRTSKAAALSFTIVR